MIFSIPLRTGTVLANVRYKFIVGTVEGSEQSSGITQPDTNFAVFLFEVVPPPGTTEIIAYDTTDLTNWNVGSLSTTNLGTPSLVTPTTLVALSTPYRVPFKRVFDSVARLHGLNPKEQLGEDIANSLLEHINARVESIALGWQWPEWDVTEERAFRQVWADDRQFYRVNAVGLPDEVFYIPTTSYWKVDVDAPSDPVVGVPPSSTTDGWVELDPVDTYIEYNQVCKRAIGQVYGVYGTDPRISRCCNGSLLRYHPSEKGIDVCNPSGPTVFVLYQMPVPSYSMTPFVQGRTYVRGDVIIDLTIGECFQALDTTTLDPANALTIWRHVPFLTKWYNFVRWGAFADSLGEMDQGQTFDPATRANAASNAENKASMALQQQVDSLVTQGQKLQWNFKRRGFWCESQPWSGGSVTTLTDACESSGGWVFPVPPSPSGIHWEYHPEIVSLRGPALPSLAGFPTFTWAVYSVIKIVIDPGTGFEDQEYRLRAGTSDELDPGQVQPNDYNANTNNKHWERIGP